MKKKPSKDIIVYKQTRPKGCSICQDKQPALYYNSNQLIKKFYLPQIESYHFRSLNDIIFDAYSKNYMSYEEVLKDTSQQHMVKFNNWNNIVSSIRKVILERCENNFYGYVDFKQQCYDITMGSYLRRKQFLNRRKVNSSPYKSSLSTQQTAEDRNLLDCLESRILTKHLEKVQAKKKQQKVLDSVVTNASILQLQKLTKNLDAMVDPVMRKQQRRSVKSKNNMLSPKKNKIPLQSNFINLKSFKKELEKQISVINKNEDDLIILDRDSENKCEQFLQINDIKETYGLKVFKPNPAVMKKQQKNASSSEKLSVPMTPKPRFQFTNNEYEQRFVPQTPRIDIHKVSNPQSPCLYRANCSSRNSTTSTKSLKKINSVNSKKSTTTTTKLKSPSTKIKK